MASTNAAAMEVDAGTPDTTAKRSREEIRADAEAKRQAEAQDKEAKREKREEERERRQAQQRERDVAFDQLERDRQADRARRVQFLLNQTDIFQHFLDASTSTGHAKKSLRELLASVPQETLSPRKSSTADAGGDAGSPNRRRRKSEKEEDAELIQIGASDDTVFQFQSTPKYINGEMREYQIHGLNWMISLHENGISGILADEMGLGKSLQTVSLLGYLKHYRNINGPHLLVTPKTTLHNWLNEFNKWCPTIDAFILHGSKEERPEQIERLLAGNFEVCITSYEMVLLEKAALKKLPWQYIIIDEAHRIKNENSMLSQIMRILESKNRLLVTGTPLQNNLHELWALLNFLLPDVFGSSDDFDSWFTFANENDKEATVHQLHKLLKPFLLRRLKLDVEKSLKPKKETKLYLGMSDLQRDLYQKLLMKDIDAINGAVGKSEGKTRLLNIVMQLRKCCNHPYLFDGVEPGPPYTTDMHIITASGKLMVLDKLLHKMKEAGSRVLLFSQMSRMLDILEDYCVFRGFSYCRIDGSTAHEDRQQQIDEYNKPDSEKFIFLLTTRAGGLGINLATADIVILYDSDWNPQVDLQAQDRAHRIGQKKQVHVFRFVTEKSVEEKMIERAEMKLRLDQLVIQQGRLADQQKAASKEELLSMIQFGAQEILHTKDKPGFIVDDIEDIIRKGEEKTMELQQKLKDAGLDVLQGFSLDGGSTSVYQWEGEDYREKQAGSAGSRLNWIEPAKRDRKANYNIDEYYRDALAWQRAPSAPKVPRPPKQPHCADYQFYPPRLQELYQRELHYYWKQIGYKVPRPEGPDGEQKQREEQEKVDNAVPLTPEEEEEKEALRKEGFEDWTRRDFQAFVKACERYGRDDKESISREVEGKTPEEVKEYLKVFLARYKELADWEKIINNIEKGEAKIKRREEIQAHLRWKMENSPRGDLRINYGQSNKVKVYTEDEDRFLVTTLYKLGYGEEDVYDRIRQEIRNAPQFRFDWFLKSRTSLELSRRCATLISLIEKEHNEFEAAEAEREKKRLAEAQAAARKHKAALQASTPPPSSKKGGKAAPAPAGKAAAAAAGGKNRNSAGGSSKGGGKPATPPASGSRRGEAASSASPAKRRK